MSKAFFDTNILIYGCDDGFPRKKSISLTLIEHASAERNGCLSTQVFQEFYSVATRRLHIAPLTAKTILTSFFEWETAVITAEDITRAIDGNVLWQVSFWDALILVAAARLKCDRIYTEDLSHGQVINGVRIINPYHENI